MLPSLDAWTTVEGCPDFLKHEPWNHSSMEYCHLCGMAKHEGLVHLCTSEVVSLLSRATT
jgi:hypothetical protein